MLKNSTVKGSPQVENRRVVGSRVRVGRSGGAGPGETRATRPGFADSGTWVPESAKMEGRGQLDVRGKFSFANSSTQMLEFAKLRVVGGQGSTGLQIRALACLNLQNAGWWVVGRGQGGQGGSMLQIRVRECSDWQTRGGWAVREAPVCKFEQLRARICKTRGGGW